MVQMTMQDCGVDMLQFDGVFSVLSKQLEKHNSIESIPHLQFMIAIEERALRIQKGIHRQRCEVRLEMYRSRLLKIQTKGVA
ncbi:hypothetical protein [Bacillus sp. FJAT-28004]|uniref:hypothetical protein n=1 Tax=Bacillus sp. FJAT-28004 TaxID=1679165 RepID=UPI0006B630D9|nr:hypothetical protein [Bacillus sp. FJAT-28004]